MRVSTAFNRLLQIPGASVTDVVIGDRDVEVILPPRARLLRCPCGMLAKAFYDRRRRRWRHLDLGRHRLWLVYEIRRLDCPDCGGSSKPKGHDPLEGVKVQAAERWVRAVNADGSHSPTIPTRFLR